jgi:hypothetical protein
VSRRGHTFTKFTLLAQDIAHSVRATSAVLDGEINCPTCGICAAARDS